MTAPHSLRRLRRLLVPALIALLLPAPALAQHALLVIGDSAAAACYRHARAGDSSREALATCSRGVLEARGRRDVGATYVNRAIIHINREEYDRALADVDKSVEYREFAEAYATRGVIYFHLDRMEESIAQATLAIERDDLDEPAKVYYNRALAYEQLDRIEEAYYDYLRASELEPGWRRPRQELERFTVLPADEAGDAAS
jgi:tetratricopeptide (TPR) repeat protein